jgi:hypothetical protein
MASAALLCEEMLSRRWGWVSNTFYTKEIIVLISELLQGPFVLVFVGMRKIVLKV